MKKDDLGGFSGEFGFFRLNYTAGFVGFNFHVVKTLDFGFVTGGGGWKDVGMDGKVGIRIKAI